MSDADELAAPTGPVTTVDEHNELTAPRLHQARGHKVTAEIAEIRGIDAGKPSISPNRHVEAPDIAGLLALIDTRTLYR